MWMDTVLCKNGDLQRAGAVMREEMGKLPDSSVHSQVM